MGFFREPFNQPLPLNVLAEQQHSILTRSRPRQQSVSKELVAPSLISSLQQQGKLFDTFHMFQHGRRDTAGRLIGHAAAKIGNTVLLLHSSSLASSSSIASPLVLFVVFVVRGEHLLRVGIIVGDASAHLPPTGQVATAAAQNISDIFFQKRSSIAPSATLHILGRFHELCQFWGDGACLACSRIRHVHGREEVHHGCMCVFLVRLVRRASKS